MNNKMQTIGKTVAFLNNADDEGELWLPNIERRFVWPEGRICYLRERSQVDHVFATSALRRVRIQNPMTGCKHLTKYGEPRPNQLAFGAKPA